MIGSFSDEDVKSAERDDGQLDCIGPCWNPALIQWNEGEASIVLDTSDGAGVADACKGGTRPVPASRRHMPTVGANCRCIKDNIREEGSSRRGEDVGAIGRR